LPELPEEYAQRLDPKFKAFAIVTIEAMPDGVSLKRCVHRVVLGFSTLGDATIVPGTMLRLAAPPGSGRDDENEGTVLVTKVTAGNAVASWENDCEFPEPPPETGQLLTSGPPHAAKDHPKVHPPIAAATNAMPHRPKSFASSADASVLVSLLVTPAGTVKDARVVEGEDALALPALRSVASWRFTPATVDGTPVQWRLSRLVRFR
jgi:hypothetical protein